MMSIKKKLKLKLFKKIKTIVGINLNFYEAILSFLLNLNFSLVCFLAVFLSISRTFRNFVERIPKQFF